MADRYIKRSMDILFDVLIKVDKFILMIDFVVLDYDVDLEVPIILGRPFLAKDCALVNVELGEFKFRVGGEYAMKFSVSTPTK